jgi:hypothetical protein
LYAVSGSSRKIQENQGGIIWLRDGDGWRRQPRSVEEAMRATRCPAGKAGRRAETPAASERFGIALDEH